MFNIAIPSALYFVEFLMNSIYYELDKWYLCFVSAAIAMCNV